MSILPLLTRRNFLKTAAAILAVSGPAIFPVAARADLIAFKNRYSPLNAKRPWRRYGRYIILHTTEGEEEGSLNRIVRYGLAHYVVCPSGTVYRVIDKAKIAKHAGRSMWEGHSVIDNYSIGIEVVGYHNRDIKE